jgi:hypothetical protein
LPAKVLYVHSREIQSKPAIQIHSPNLKNYAFLIFELRNSRIPNGRVLGIGSTVSADDVRCAPQIQCGADQINSCDPKTGNFDPVDTQPIFLTFKK